MGYIFLLIIGGAVLVGVLILLMSGGRRPAGRAKPYNDVTPRKPEAEDANPAASSTATAAQADAAQKHTPPA